MMAHLIVIFRELYPKYFYENKQGRNRDYPLEDLLGLTVWGDINNNESCRAKAQLCRNFDESVRVLIDGKPSKSKINDFSNEHKELIQAFDDFIVEFCYVSGLVEGNEFVGDGTFLDGWCNDFKALYPDEIKYIQKFLTEHDKHKTDYSILYSYYYLQNEVNDDFMRVKKELKDNINIHGINLIIKSLESDDEYQKVMNKLDHMSENITKDTVKISITDPDAHNMEDKDKNWGFHYNLQEITDTKCGVIVDHYICKNPNDKNEVEKMVCRLINKFKHEGFDLGLDNGYWNLKLLINIIQETCVEIVIPDKNNASKNKEKIIKDNKSNKKYDEYVKRKNKNKKHRTFIESKDFNYLEDEDAFECPLTKYELSFQQITEDKNGIEYREYWTNECKKCPYLNKCTSQNKRKLRRINEPEIIHINSYYHSEKGKEVSKKRGYYAEGNFAILLGIRNFRGIKVLGIDKVDLELTRFVIVHNTMKIAENMELTVLKKVLKYIKSQKKNRRATIDMLYELQGNFIEKDGKIIDVLI